MSAVHFRVNIPQEILDDLQERLARTRWPDEVRGAGWEYGVSRAYLQELIEYWRTQFDWRRHEHYLNRFSHFRTEVAGFGIHFIQQRGNGPAPLPLLLTHGWPDSFFRFHKLIPLLTDPASHGGAAEDAFDVVVPSLPGFGFSDKPTERGMSERRIAELFHALMTDTLRYRRFGAHGGDWGSGVTEAIALAHPASLVGIHLTDVPYWHLFTMPQDKLSQAEQDYLAAGRKWQQESGGYAMIQSTSPQTLSCGLNDSPVGLAAWIIEPFRRWSDCGGDVETRFTRDELLTNIFLYWATGTIASANRLYYESLHAARTGTPEGRVETPTGVALFPHDLVSAPRQFAERFFNIQRWTEMPRGGHFAAMEEPELLAEELRAFFRPLRA